MEEEILDKKNNEDIINKGLAIILFKIIYGFFHNCFAVLIQCYLSNVVHFTQ